MCVGMIMVASCGSAPASSPSLLGPVGDPGTMIETTTSFIDESARSFCGAADRLFNQSSFASDGGGVVTALRSLDLATLADADQKAMTGAIGVVEATIAEFQGGGAPDGWSTEPAAKEAARICGQEMQRFFVMP